MTKVIKKKSSRAKLIVAGSAILLLAGAASGAYLIRSSNTQSGTTYTPEPTPTPSPTPVTSQPKSSLAPQATRTPTAATATPAAASIPAPGGQILNKGEVHLSEGNDASQYGSGMNSTCETVAGAACGFELISDKGTVKTLASQPAKADAQNNYGVSIHWNVKDLGLTEGVWRVHAVATKDGQKVKSADWQLKVVQ